MQAGGPITKGGGGGACMRKFTVVECSDVWPDGITQIFKCLLVPVLFTVSLKISGF